MKREKKERCDVCGKMFDAKNIEQHKRDAHGQRCDVCGKMFDAKNIEQHKRDAHGPKQYAKGSKLKLKWIIVGGIIAVIVGGVAYAALAPHTSPLTSPLSALTIEGVRCDTIEYNAFHVHAHLDIFINGQPFKIPAQVGIIPNKCLYWMHTHDDTGVIHLEAPVEYTFTLGKFFGIWGKTFNDTRIFDNVVSGNNTLDVYVNGNKVNGDYRDIKINRHDEIAVVYGAPPATIPSSYDFRGL